MIESASNPIETTNTIISIAVGLGVLASFLIGFVAWNIRLESKVLNLENNHKENKEATWKKIEGFDPKMDRVLLALGRIEGAIGVKLHGKDAGE